MELIQIWLTIIGAGTVVYWIVKLAIYAYEDDRKRHPNSPSVFTPWRKT